jgi:hypothetical protein
MKKITLLVTFMLVLGYSNAQSCQIQDLSNSVGNWEGTLTYLDYSSGKPFTMLANIKISVTADKKGYVVGYEYPKEPHANSIDTTFIENNHFGKEKIESFTKDSKGGFTLITAMTGVDGNDNKQAILKHTYLLQSNTLTITKEVKFDGSAIWIKRNEYLFNKAGR